MSIKKGVEIMMVKKKDTGDYSRLGIQKDQTLLEDYID